MALSFPFSVYSSYLSVWQAATDFNRTSSIAGGVLDYTNDLLIWQGRQDSNLQPSVSETDAPPLSYTPIVLAPAAGFEPATFGFVDRRSIR